MIDNPAIPGGFYSECAGARAMRSILHLVHRLIDQHFYRQRFAAAAVAHAAHWGGTQIIEPNRDAHMGVGRGDSVGGIEGDPAEIGHEGFRPGVTGILLDHAVVAVEIAADIARRDAEAARDRDENVAQVLADTALERE